MPTMLYITTHLRFCPFYQAGVNATEGDPPLRPAIEETAEIFQTQDDNHQEGNLRQEVQENVKTCTRTFKNCDPSKTNCILWVQYWLVYFCFK